MVPQADGGLDELDIDDDEEESDDEEEESCSSSASRARRRRRTPRETERVAGWPSARSATGNRNALSSVSTLTSW